MNTDRSFAQIYVELQPILRRFLIARLGNEADADDIVQETFIRYEQTAQRDVIDNPKAFAFRIARNLSVDLIRKNTRAKAREKI